jgi:hypothetical protein
MLENNKTEAGYAKLLQMSDENITPNEQNTPDSFAPRVRVYKLGEEPKDTAYWLSRSPLERMAMIERLRREFYGEEYQLQRNPETLFKITVRKLR